jgi:hypothetical protein
MEPDTASEEREIPLLRSARPTTLARREPILCNAVPDAVVDITEKVLKPFYCIPGKSSSPFPFARHIHISDKNATVPVTFVNFALSVQHGQPPNEIIFRLPPDAVGK